MDVYIETFDPMYDITITAFLQEWLSTIITIIIGAYITSGLRGLKRAGVRRDNVAKHTEFRLEAIADALSHAPDPIGSHFKVAYDKKLNELVSREKFIDSNGKD